MTGKFIVIEGVDGSGKTTLKNSLVRFLEGRNIPHIAIREPGSTPFAEDIRDLILNNKDYEEQVFPNTDLLLFFAARNQLINNVILPALKENKWVICDRFELSTYVFQVIGGKCSEQLFQDLSEIIVGFNDPDLQIIIQCPVMDAIARLKERSGDINRFDEEGILQHSIRANAYKNEADRKTFAKHTVSFDNIHDLDTSERLFIEFIEQTLEDLEWM